MLKLFSDASEVVRQKLGAADPAKRKLIQSMIAAASNRIQARTRERSEEFAVAYSHVRSLHEARTLGEAELAAFAKTGRFYETAIALALMGDFPVDLTERFMVQERSEQMIMIVARALDLSWDTAKAILAFRVSVGGGSPDQLDACQATFTKLSSETAEKVIKFYRMRAQVQVTVSTPPPNTCAKPVVSPATPRSAAGA